jgi:hypothetical protein
MSIFNCFPQHRQKRLMLIHEISHLPTVFPFQHDIDLDQGLIWIQAFFFSTKRRWNALSGESRLLKTIIHDMTCSGFCFSIVIAFITTYLIYRIYCKVYIVEAERIRGYLTVFPIPQKELPVACPHDAD